MANNRTSPVGFDWITLAIFASLVVIGALMLFATDYQEGADLLSFSQTVRRQYIWIGLSMIFFVLCLVVDWKLWFTFAYPIFGLTLFLLIFVLIFGSEIKGAKAWIVFGGLSFQPAEFAKLGTALAISSYLASSRFSFSETRPLCTALAIIMAPPLLILLQPDAGSALVFVSFFILFYRNGLSPIVYLFGLSFALVFVFSLIGSPNIVLLTLFIIGLFAYIMQVDKKLVWLGALAIIVVSSIYLFQQGFVMIALVGLAGLLFIFMLYLVRLRKAQFSITLFASIILLSLFSFGSNYAFNTYLKPHQKDRINVWLQPEKTDPRGSRYNILQSQLAIGSGGFEGKGFLNGTMTKLNYVPEQTTDFIFSTIGEEQGFLGSLGIVSLFTFLLFRITVIAERSRIKFISNYAYCVAGLIFIHYFVNIGMTMGIMPVVGIPLPFISKGGTSILIFSVMIGILLRMDLERLRRY